MSKTATYEFILEDSEGLWGSVRVRATSGKDAAAKARRLARKELEPKGSLHPGFRMLLTRRRTKRTGLIRSPNRSQR